MKRNFRDLIERKWSDRKFVCVGLDSELGKIPPHPLWDKLEGGDKMHTFNCEIVRLTGDIACAYKINSAFYEAEGAAGFAAMQKTIAQIRLLVPGVPVILDAKRADIGNTNEGYAKSAFELLGADAITVHPYLGAEAMVPFLRRGDKGIFVLCCTSNKGSAEFQGLESNGRRLYEIVADNVAHTWNVNKNCGLVAGATHPEELASIRRIVGDLPLLIPGIGAQGGEVEATVKAGKDSKGGGMIINSSRGIIFDADPRKKALELHEQIVSFL